MQSFIKTNDWIRLGLLLAAMLIITACPAATEPPAATEEAPAAEATQPATEAPADTGEATQAGALDPAERVGMYSTPPEMIIDPDKYYYATLKTDKGDIRVQLFARRVPNTVNNFVFLAREGYYDNTTFHRVLEEFMAQAGDPSATGAGGPGYQFPDEIVQGLEFDRAGLLAMANAGPGTNGSQFFITFAPTPWLTGAHTIFGEVIEGMEVLNELTLRDPNQNPDFEGDLLETVTIEESDTSVLPTPLPPTPTPTPYAPSSIAPQDLTAGDRPLADLPGAEKSNAFNTAPEMVIDTTQTYRATIVTSQGELVVSLNTETAPMAVNNFVLLASLGFYDGTPINDVSEVVIIGAPENNPTSFVGYFFPMEINATAEVGVGAMAYLPAQDPATGEVVNNGSQLLIVREQLPVEVAGQLSFFGQVVSGEDVLNNLTVDDTIESIQIETE